MYLNTKKEETTYLFEKLKSLKKDKHKDFFTADSFDFETLEHLELDFSNSLGEWVDDYLSINYHLIKEDNTYFIIYEFDDNSFHKKKVSFKILGDTLLFLLLNSSKGEYFLLKDTVLESWDDEGRLDRYIGLCS